MEVAAAPHITPRQRQVLDLLVKGYSNAQIAEALGVSLDGAKWHVREILSALGVDGREEAAEFWREQQGLPRRLRRLANAIFPASWARVAPVGAGAVGAVAVAVVVGILVSNGSSDSGGKDSASTETATPEPSPTVTPVAILPSPPASTPEPVVLSRTLRVDPPSGDCDQVFRLIADKFEPTSTVEFHRWNGLNETVLLANDRLVGHDLGASLDGLTLPDDCFPGAEYVYEVRPLGGGVAVDSRAVFSVDQIGTFEAVQTSAGCDPFEVSVHGTGLPPGMELDLAWGGADPFTHNFAGLGRATAAPDGTLVFTATLGQLCASPAIGIYGGDRSGAVRARWKAVVEVGP